MRFLTAVLCVLCAWASFALPASAGWDNVFQPTLFWRRPASTSNYYVAPVVVGSSPVYVAQASPCNTCAPACPQPACTTNYVQRSYYQPVTTYTTQTQYEAVTSYRTSYYYEPVTSYRISNYYDPCTGCAQQVATPTTSYQLKAQSCPVQSWVARCVQVPVQSYQKVDYWQPQTTCCSTTMGAPVVTVAPPVVASPPPLVNPVPAPPQTEQPPSIRGDKTPGTSMQKPDMWQQYYPPIEKTPETKNTTSWQPQLGVPVPVQQTPAPQPPVKLDRISVGPNSTVTGQVVRADNSPKPSAKVLFVNASTGLRHTINANTAGRFQVELPAGSWHMYLYGANDLPTYHSRVDVNGAQYRQVNLVSRSN